jgi:hypothetical protein
MNFARLGLVPVLGLLPLLGFGCSDPVPPTPRGAWALGFVDPGPDCEVGGHNAAMGNVTKDTKTKVLVDGQDGASIDCTVTGSSSYRVEAFSTDSQNGLQLGINIGSITAQATKEAPAVGSVSFSSPNTGGEPAYSDANTPCNFWFVPKSGEGIGSGKIWVAFECPKVTINMSTACKISSGFAIFENCET